MKLVCPGCGATASLEAWDNDVVCRQTVAALVELPGELPVAALGYLGLFRPAQRALSWKKALRLVQEVAALTSTSYIQIQGKVARPCTPRIWAQAMDDMVGRSYQLSRPMKNHNYLKQVAYDLADKADAANERSIHQAEQSGDLLPVREDSQENVKPLSQKEIDALPAYLRESYLKVQPNAN